MKELKQDKRNIDARKYYLKNRERIGNNQKRYYLSLKTKLADINLFNKNGKVSVRTYDNSNRYHISYCDICHLRVKPDSCRTCDPCFKEKLWI